MGIGSWPRPGWMLRAIHEHAEGRLGDSEFDAAADDAVRLAVGAQIRAGVDVVTDGEQRRTNSPSFIAGRLENCRIVSFTELLPLVGDAQKCQAELGAFDVPASVLRHPTVVGPLRRSQPLVGHEYAFVRTLTERPVKVALPGPLVLTRLMWVVGLAERVYRSREDLAENVVHLLREELHALLATGVALVQLDEPVLAELGLARRLLAETVAGFPRERLALHVCRSNWTREGRLSPAGSYRPLLPLLADVPVGTLFLELSTPQADDMDVLRELPRDVRLGIGVVDPKRDAVEPTSMIAARVRPAVALFGPERVALTPECGFAAFADTPTTSARAAEATLRALVEAAALVRRG